MLKMEGAALVESAAQSSGLLDEDGYFCQEDWEFKADLMAGESPEKILSAINQAAVGAKGLVTIDLIKASMKESGQLHFIPIKE